MSNPIEDAVNNGGAIPDDVAAELLKVQDLIEREQKIKEEAKRLGIPREAIKAEIRRRQKRPGPNGTAAPVDIRTLEESAAQIIQSTNVLALFEKQIKLVIAGEELNAKLLFLVGTSRLLKKTMSAAIKGTSAGGKSELR